VFIHGIGDTHETWNEIVKLLPNDVRLIGIDLLGHGKSPKPDWAVYDAKTQARSVGVTLLRLRLAHQPVLVGHSMGALVSVEVAKRYSVLARRLVLCSPPFYKPEVHGKRIKSNDDVLREIYRVATKRPERLIKLLPLLIKLGIASKSLSVTEGTLGPYLGALEASIINQTALEDSTRLKLPIDIFYGTFDPVIIKKHIVRLGKDHENVTVHRLVAGHEMVGGYGKSIADFLLLKD
jgi:pimeloyl-ACP methyl ester carboxylesterase